MEKIKKNHSKVIVSILFAVLLIGSNGCLTQRTIKCAEGHPTEAWLAPPDNDYPPEPGYYALLPLTIPADVVTSPIQVIGYVALCGLAVFGAFH